MSSFAELILSGVVVGATIALTLWTLANQRRLVEKVRGSAIGRKIQGGRPFRQVGKSKIEVDIPKRGKITDGPYLVSTVFGAGFLRPASGTWASAFAVALGVAAYEAGFALLVPIGAVAATLLGFMAVPAYLRQTGGEDPSEVVIDEVAGQWLALSFTVLPLWWHGVPNLLTGAWPGWVVPFLLFRLFDIWKPGLVGRADRRGDPAGVMLDDLWAGLFAGIGSIVLAGAYHGAMAWLS